MSSPARAPRAVRPDPAAGSPPRLSLGSATTATAAASSPGTLNGRRRSRTSRGRTSSPQAVHHGSRNQTPTMLCAPFHPRRPSSKSPVYRADDPDPSLYVDLAHDEDFQQLKSTLQGIDQGNGRLLASQLAELRGNLGPFYMSQEDFEELQDSLDIVLLHVKREGMAFERVAQYFYPRVSRPVVRQQFAQWPARPQVQELYGEFCGRAVMGVDGTLRMPPPPAEGLMFGPYFLSLASCLEEVAADDEPPSDYSDEGPGLTFEQLLRALFPSMQRAAASCFAKDGIDFWEYAELRQIFDVADRHRRSQIDTYDFLCLPPHRGVHFNLQFFLHADTEKTGMLSFAQLLSWLFPLIPSWYLAYAIRHWQDAEDPEPQETSTRDIRPARPPLDTEELTEANMLYLFDVFDALDCDHLGELSAAQLVGRSVEGLTISAQDFRRMDLDRSGTVSFSELLRHLFPRIPRLNVARLCQTSISAKELIILRQQYRKVSSHGVLRPTKLEGRHTFVQGVELQRLDFAGVCGGGPVRFPDFLRVLFPAVDLKEIHRVTCTEIPEREYFRLKYAFQTLDVEMAGYLTVPYFNRCQPAVSCSYSDTLRQQRDETMGGMKFDMKAFNVLDLDGSGTVTFDEYLYGWYPSLERSTIRQMIERWGGPHQQGRVPPTEQTVEALRAQEEYSAQVEVHKLEANEGRQKWQAALQLVRPELRRQRQARRQLMQDEGLGRVMLRDEEAAARVELEEHLERFVIEEEWAASLLPWRVVWAELQRGAAALAELHHRQQWEAAAATFLEREQEGRVAVMVEAVATLEGLHGEAERQAAQLKAGAAQRAALAAAEQRQRLAVEDEWGKAHGLLAAMAAVDEADARRAQAFPGALAAIGASLRQLSPSNEEVPPGSPDVEASPSAASSISSRLFLDLSSPASSPAGATTPSAAASQVAEGTQPSAPVEAAEARGPPAPTSEDPPYSPVSPNSLQRFQSDWQSSVRPDGRESLEEMEVQSPSESPLLRTVVQPEVGDDVTYGPPCMVAGPSSPSGAGQTNDEPVVEEAVSRPVQREDLDRRHRLYHAVVGLQAEEAAARRYLHAAEVKDAAGLTLPWLNARRELAAVPGRLRARVLDVHREEGRGRTEILVRAAASLAALLDEWRAGLIQCGRLRLQSLQREEERCRREVAVEAFLAILALHRLEQAEAPPALRGGAAAPKAPARSPSPAFPRPSVVPPTPEQSPRPGEAQRAQRSPQRAVSETLDVPRSQSPPHRNASPRGRRSPLSAAQGFGASGTAAEPFDFQRVISVFDMTIARHHSPSLEVPVRGAWDADDMRASGDDWSPEADDADVLAVTVSGLASEAESPAGISTAGEDPKAPGLPAPSALATPGSPTLPDPGPQPSVPAPQPATPSDLSEPPAEPATHFSEQLRSLGPPVSHSDPPVDPFERAVPPEEQPPSPIEQHAPAAEPPTVQSEQGPGRPTPPHVALEQPAQPLEPAAQPPEEQSIEPREPAGEVDPAKDLSQQPIHPPEPPASPTDQPVLSPEQAKEVADQPGRPPGQFSEPVENAAEGNADQTAPPSGEPAAAPPGSATPVPPTAPDPPTPLDQLTPEDQPPPDLPPPPPVNEPLQALDRSLPAGDEPAHSPAELTEPLDDATPPLDDATPPLDLSTPPSEPQEEPPRPLDQPTPPLIPNSPATPPPPPLFSEPPTPRDSTPTTQPPATPPSGASRRLLSDYPAGRPKHIPPGSAESRNSKTDASTQTSAAAPSTPGKCCLTFAAYVPRSPLATSQLDAQSSIWPELDDGPWNDGCPLVEWVMTLYPLANPVDFSHAVPSAVARRLERPPRTASAPASPLSGAEAPNVPPSMALQHAETVARGIIALEEACASLSISRRQSLSSSPRTGRLSGSWSDGTGDRPGVPGPAAVDEAAQR